MASVFCRKLRFFFFIFSVLSMAAFSVQDAQSRRFLPVENSPVPLCSISMGGKGGGYTYIIRKLPQSTPAGRAASSPSQALTRQTPPFVTCGDIFPRSGGSLSSKGEPLAKPVTWHLSRKLYRHAKASPFGRGGSERSELTERARLLPRSAAASAGSRRCKCRFPPRPHP